MGALFMAWVMFMTRSLSVSQCYIPWNCQTRKSCLCLLLKPPNTILIYIHQEYTCGSFLEERFPVRLPAPAYPSLRDDGRPQLYVKRLYRQRRQTMMRHWRHS